MSGAGTIGRGDPARIACGELALLGACTAAARLDFEHDEGRRWLATACELAGQLPPGAVMLSVLAFHRLTDKLELFRRAVEDTRRLPTGERDWIPAGRAQGELREALTDAMAALHNRAMPVWSWGEAPPWAAPVAEPVEAAEPVAEGVG